MTTAEPAPAGDSPGVLVMPPLLYLVAIVLGVGLHLVWPFLLPIQGVWRWLLPLPFLLLAAIGGSGRAAFARAGTEANPFRSSSRLVVSGPYRFTRNPMYVGLTAALVAIALATRIAWILIELPVVLALMHWGVVLREERYLTRRFGAEYEAYRSRVRRYL